MSKEPKIGSKVLAENIDQHFEVKSSPNRIVAEIIEGHRRELEQALAGMTPEQVRQEAVKRLLAAGFTEAELVRIGLVK